jgi:hypothetical protein
MVSATGTVSMVIEDDQGIVAEVNVPFALDLEQGIVHFQGRDDAPPTLTQGPEVERHTLRCLRSLLPQELRDRLPDCLRSHPTEDVPAPAAPDRRRATA